MTNGTNDIIDPEEVFLGDDNKPVDGSSLLGGDPKPEGPEGGQKDQPPGQNDPPEGGKQDDPLAPGSVNPEDFSNPAEYALKWLGYEGDEVDFGDGNKVKLNELTPEQQSDVLMNQLERVVDTYEAEIARLKTEGPELGNPMAKQIFDFLKQNGDPKELAKFILENDPQAMATSLSAEDKVKRYLGETMSLEGDELDAELNFLKENGRLDAYAERATKYLQGKGVDLTGLTAQQQQAIQAQQQEAIRQFEDEKTELVNYVGSVKELAGIPVKKEINDFIVSQIVPTDPNQDSPFLQQLNNPAKLHRLAFLDNYFEDIVDNLKTTYFEMGKNSVTSASAVLQKEPIAVRSFRGSSQRNSPGVVGPDGKVNLDKLANTDIVI